MDSPVPAPVSELVGDLTDRQRDMFDFERTWWSFDEPRDELIRARFGCSPEQYYVELNAVLDTPEALAHDPLVVRRFQRRRARRRRELQGNNEARRTVEGQTS